MFAGLGFRVESQGLFTKKKAINPNIPKHHSPQNWPQIIGSRKKSFRTQYVDTSSCTDMILAFV